MREAAPGAEVTLHDLDAPVLKWLLRFLYTDEIEKEAWEDDEALCHLFAAAHKYEVRGLLERCEIGIAARLTEENAAERLMMADMLEAVGLRKRVLDFACHSKERLGRVQSTEGFARLAQKRPQLLVDMMAAMAPPAPKKRKAEAGSEPLPANLETKRVVELKQLCSDRGIYQTGSKADLLCRLRAHHRQRQEQQNPSA